MTGWPKSMPFLAVVTQGSLLSLGTAMLAKDCVASCCIAAFGR